MVKETKIVFELSDILAMRFECGFCHSETTVALQCTMPSPTVCGVCEQKWRWERGQDDVIANMLSALRLVLRSKDMPVGLRFEMDADSNGGT